MNKEDQNFYRDPCTGESLRLESPQIDGHEIIDGHLSNSEGIKYPILEGVPDLIWPKELEVSDREMLETYDA